MSRGIEMNALKMCRGWEQEARVEAEAIPGR
jgi:hypothetical protein